MDLGAYANIGNLEDILRKNDIKITRLRGLRLMKNEVDIASEEDIAFIIHREQVNYAIDWLRNHDDYCQWKWGTKHRAFIYGKNEEGEKYVVDIDMRKVHGKDRKHIKMNWKWIAKRVRANLEMWNSYVGKNVLYVHARQGGGNRPYFPIDTKHPLYLSDVDDWFDTTYCDIYYDLEKANGQNEG